MPLAAQGYERKSLELLNYLVEILEEEAGELEIAFVSKGEERLIPEYPAVLVAPEGKSRDLHGTHTFQLRFFFTLWVYHARMEKSHSQRLEDDILLVENIEDFLHGNLGLGGRVIQGWVTSENPGFFNRAKGEVVVGTRMVYEAISQERFK